MIYYKSILGSRCLDLHSDNSDYDVITLGEGADCIHDVQRAIIDGKDFNYLYIAPAKALKNMFFVMDVPLQSVWGIQYFYPSEILIDTELTQYLIQHRDDFFAANKHNLYLAHLNHLNFTLNYPQKWGKNSMYALYDADMILKFAKDISYTECKTLSEEEKKKYQDIRLNYNPEIWNEIEDKRQQALKLRYKFEHQDNHELLKHYNNITECMNGTQINLDLFRYN